MEQQVLIRRRRLHGDPILDRADVISENKADGTLTVRALGSRQNEIIAAADTVSVKSVFGQNPSTTIPIQAFPDNRHALCNSLRKE